MATVATRINRALRLLNQIGAGDSATADELADGLVSLNAMLDSWRNDKLMCYAYQEETCSLTANDSTYTLGPSGDLTTTRPVEIMSAYILVSGNQYPVTMRDETWWARIPDQTLGGDWPSDAIYRPTMPNGTIQVWPVQSSSRTMKVVTRVVVSAFASTSTTVTLPPGWEAAIDFNLALEIAPEYEAEPSPFVVKRAAETLAGIKRANLGAQPFQAETELGALFGARSGNIYTDA